MGGRNQIIDRAGAAYNRHDAAGFASCFAEDGVLRTVAFGEAAEGREQIEALMEGVWRAFPDWTLETRGVCDCGDTAWLAWTITGTHEGEFRGIPPTHRRFEMLGCSHFTLAGDGLIAQDDIYFDSATMMRQLGWLPEPEATQPT
jgi:steroid delta-isomerase-like uncharacterized protein